jgi:hypothetical protein
VKQDFAVEAHTNDYMNQSARIRIYLMLVDADGQ